MALNKKITKENGVETSYHRITGVCLEVEAENSLMLIIRLESYLDREYRDKAQPIYSKNYNLPLTSDESTDNMGIRQFAYDKLKQLLEWSDAVDC
jgi:hypothetical protein